jgi:hypothetical protein
MTIVSRQNPKEKDQSMSDPDAQRLQHYIELLEDELRQAQRRQQALIAALERAKAELGASEGGITIFDGEPIG